MAQALLNGTTAPLHQQARPHRPPAAPVKNRVLERDGRALERGVRALFTNSGYGVLSGVECLADGATLSLYGRVDLYYHKQLAQEIAARVAGVRRVQNFIRVAG